MRADISKEADVRQSPVEATLGPVDILVNNAGITRDGLTAGHGRERLGRRALGEPQGRLPHEQGGTAGHDQATPWLDREHLERGGRRGNAGQVNYSAAKAGLIGLTKSLAREVASRNVRVNAVAPGYIETDMTAALDESARNAIISQIPLGRIGTPEAVADAVAFLAADSASFITGAVLAVDGGLGI